AGFPKIPILLVTSCVPFEGGASLFFIDPSSATVVKTLSTTVTPDFGWEALTPRADQGDLMGCGRVGAATNLYAIHFSSFDPISPATSTTATATLLRNSPTGATCDGIAWDPSNKTIYQSSTTADVLHLTVTGNATPPTVPSGCGSATAGL